MATEVELGTAELQAREARFSVLVQNASDLVTIVDTDATVLFQSPSVERILGWDVERSLGTNLLDSIHGLPPVSRTHGYAASRSRCA